MNKYDAYWYRDSVLYAIGKEKPVAIVQDTIDFGKVVLYADNTFEKISEYKDPIDDIKHVAFLKGLIKENKGTDDVWVRAKFKEICDSITNFASPEQKRTFIVDGVCWDYEKTDSEFSTVWRFIRSKTMKPLNPNDPECRSFIIAFPENITKGLATEFELPSVWSKTKCEI